MPRLFIGIPLPASYHDESALLVRDLRNRLRSRVRWVPIGNAHITLYFLGEVPDADIPHIKTALQAISPPSFHMRAGSCGVFPDPKRPRIVYARITKGAKPCADLANTIATAMVQLGHKAPVKEYTAHITLGRIKELARDDWQKLISDNTISWPGFKVNSFMLWQSDLTSEGPIYTPIADFPLS